MDPSWVPACTGYPGADNNANNNAYYDRWDSYGYLSLIVKRQSSACAHICLNEYALRLDIERTGITFQWEKISHETFPKIKISNKFRINV